MASATILHDNDLFQEFRGAISENYVAQALSHSKYPLFYWTSSGKAEIDFIVEQEGLIYPLEVKSGNSSKKKSLKVYEDSYHPSVLIRCSPKNLRKDGTILNCPIYLTQKLRHLIAKTAP